MAVPDALAPYVASLVAYDVDLGAPGVHRGLPGTTLTFVLPVGEPLDVGWAGRRESRARRWSTLSGLHPHPAEIHHDGTQVGVQVALTVAGARALLGVPAAALVGALVELGDVDRSLRHLPEQLAAVRPAQRRALVEAALLERLRRTEGEARASGRPEVGRALAALTRGAGVERTAAEVGYSRRHLSSLVRAECGLTPRELRRLGRFERSRTLLGRVPMAQVAHRSGYADQAHLSREWVTLAGCPPTIWLREEFPFLQDLRPAEDPESGT